MGNERATFGTRIADIVDRRGIEVQAYPSIEKSNGAVNKPWYIVHVLNVAEPIQSEDGKPSDSVYHLPLRLYPHHPLQWSDTHAR